MFGHGQLVIAAVAYAAGVATFPVGRAALKALAVKIVDWTKAKAKT